MAEQKRESSFLLRKVSNQKEVIITVSDFMKEILKRLKGSDPVNDEIIIGKDLVRISSLQEFDGKARLHLSVTGGLAVVTVENANEIEPGLFEARYQEAVILIPDQSKSRFSRWEGENASQVQSIGDGRYSLLMDSVDKTLVAVFETVV